MHRSLGDCLAFAYTILVGMAEGPRERERRGSQPIICAGSYGHGRCLSPSPRDGIPLIRASHSIEMPRYIGFRTKVRKCACLIG